MFNRYKNWLLNAPILNKLSPLKRITMVVIISLGCIASFSSHRLNIAQKQYSETIENTEIINSIFTDLYLCRIIVRDIIIENENKEKIFLYNDELHAKFNEIDRQVELLAERMSSERLERFSITILKKDLYREHMFLLADTVLIFDDEEFTMEILEDVKIISVDFYENLESYIEEEKSIIEELAIKNQQASLNMFVIVVFLCISSALFVFLSINFTVKHIVGHILSLSNSVSKITETKSMKNDIPEEFFTNDEIGLMAKIIHRLKTLLLDNIMQDSLTGGYNATAYRADLDDYFDNNNEIVTFWLLIFDMNNLKQINDNLGHIAGDKAIICAYAALESSFSQFGKVYRVGGDEFTAILSACSENEIIQCIDELTVTIEHIAKVEMLDFSIATGYNKFTGKTRDEYDEFYKTVDMKMYSNKSFMKNNRVRARSK